MTQDTDTDVDNNKRNSGVGTLGANSPGMDVEGDGVEGDGMEGVRSRGGKTGSKDGRRTWTDQESDRLREVMEHRDGEREGISCLSC